MSAGRPQSNFKSGWIKQHLRINASTALQRRCADANLDCHQRHVLVAIIKKQLRLDASLHALLQILSLTLFEKLPLKQAVSGAEQIANNPTFHSQLNSIRVLTGHY